MKRLLVTGSLAVLLAGCSHDPGGLEASDSPVAHYDWSEDSGMQALLEGKLEMRNGCLVVMMPGSGASNDTFVVPVFPRKYVSWDAGREMLTFNGVEYEMGDEIAAGGGWVPPTDDMEFPTTCEPDASGDVMLVQDTSLATMSDRGY